MPKSTGSKRVAAAQLAGQAAVVEGWDEGFDQEYELVDVDELKEHPDNQNIGDEDAIRESMDVNGWFGAVLVQRSTGFIIAHNHAFRVAKQKGALQIPVIWKDVDDVEALRILLADNETARRSYRDEDRTREILDSLGSLEGTGIRLEDLERHEGAREDREAAEEATKARGEGEGAEAGGDFGMQYGVVVVCADETEQQSVYDLLRAEGWDCRPVSV